MFIIAQSGSAERLRRADDAATTAAVQGPPFFPSLKNLKKEERLSRNYISPPWRTQIKRENCTPISLQHQSAAIAITPILTLPFMSPAPFQSEKIRDCQNIIKFKWDGVYFDWKVSVKISMKSDLVKFWKNWHDKKERHWQEKWHTNNRQKVSPSVFLFIRTHERVNWIRNPCRSGTVEEKWRKEVNWYHK